VEAVTEIAAKATIPAPTEANFRRADFKLKKVLHLCGLLGKVGSLPDNVEILDHWS
jgi:hypothetical protein